MGARSNGVETMSVYYSVKRKISRIGCLLGRHNYKMGASAKGGGSFGCMWCGKKLRPVAGQNRTGTVAEMTCPDCKLRVFWSNESERYEHHYGNMDKNPMPCPAQSKTDSLLT